MEENTTDEVYNQTSERVRKAMAYWIITSNANQDLFSGQDEVIQDEVIQHKLTE